MSSEHPTPWSYGKFVEDYVIKDANGRPVARPSGKTPEERLENAMTIVRSVNAAAEYAPSARSRALLDALHCWMERPDGTDCAYDPDDAARQFMTHWELGVCDGDGKEVGDETIADALNAVAAIQFAWGYWTKPEGGKGKEKEEG